MLAENGISEPDIIVREPDLKLLATRGPAELLEQIQAGVYFVARQPPVNSLCEVCIKSSVLSLLPVGYLF
jgi:hypothetical protein